MARSFRWKRKMPQNVAKKRAALFDERCQEPEDEPYEIDWRVLMIKRGTLSIEDNVAKSKRLTEEGIALAEQQRYG